MEAPKYFYYRIYDDKEEINFIKSSLLTKQMQGLIKEFEKTHKKYVASSFVKFVRKQDPEVEIIKIKDLSF